MDSHHSIRSTRRRQLLGKLTKLSSPYPSVRDRAAAELSAMIARRQLDWDKLLVPAAANDDEAPAGDWPAPALALLGNASLTEDERSELHRLAAWRAPGRSGLERLRAIAARVKDANDVHPS